MNNNYLQMEVFYLINKVEIASVNTSKLPMLSNEEKNELLKRVKNGDEIAREKFVERKFEIGTERSTKI